MKNIDLKEFLQLINEFENSEKVLKCEAEFLKNEQKVKIKNLHSIENDRVSKLINEDVEININENTVLKSLYKSFLQSKLKKIKSEDNNIYLAAIVTSKYLLIYHHNELIFKIRIKLIINIIKKIL